MLGREVPVEWGPDWGAACLLEDDGSFLSEVRKITETRITSHLQKLSLDALTGTEEYEGLPIAFPYTLHIRSQSVLVSQRASCEHTDKTGADGSLFIKVGIPSRAPRLASFAGPHCQ